MKIISLELLTDDLSGTVSFYRDLMGFELMVEETGKVSFRCGNAVLGFLKADDQKHHYHFAFEIPNNKMEEAKNWLSLKTSLLLNADNEVINRFENWNAEAVYFYDNNGNIVEFITRYDLETNSNEPFSAASVLSISEAGVVTDTPLKLADTLNSGWQIPYYIKGPKREDFLVMGEETGLLIVARTGRNWFPTENKAEKQYVKATLSAEGISKEIIIN